MITPNLLKPALWIMFALISLSSYGKCLSSWQYYMPVTITNNISSSLSNYQVKIIVNTAVLVSSGKMISTGDDIRFIDASGCNNLNYWIESGINTSNTIIWVKLSTLSASSSRIISMYYGNSSATAASNGDSTFLLFDDFNESSFNSSKWTAYGQNGTLSVSNGYLNLSTPTSGRYHGETIVSNNSFTPPIIVEDNLVSLSQNWHGLGMFNAGTYDGYAAFAGLTSNTKPMYFGHLTSAYPAFGAQKSDSNANPGSITGIWQLSWPTSDFQTITWPGGNLSTSLSGITLGSSVQIGAGLITESLGNLSIDWIRCRSYASSEPSSSVAQEMANHTSGIDNQNSSDDISIYPNPVHDLLNIDFTNANLHFKNLQWMDENGKLLRTVNVDGQTGILEINTTGITKGIYFIKLIGDGGTVVQKVTLE